MDRYREKIIMSYLYLQSMRDGLLDNIINVAMSGEYKSISDTFSLGDSYEFDLLQFRDTDDASLNKLIDVYDEMDAAMDSLINLNVITDQEIEDVEKDWVDLMNLDNMEDDDEDFIDDIIASSQAEDNLENRFNSEDFDDEDQSGEELDWD